MYTPGHLCLRDDGNYFKNKTFTNRALLRKEINEGHVFEFSSYKDDVYAVSHNGLTLWFRSRTNLADVYEYLLWNKPVPQWDKFIGFIKEL